MSEGKWESTFPDIALGNGGAQKFGEGGKIRAAR